MLGDDKRMSMHEISVIAYAAATNARSTANIDNEKVWLLRRHYSSSESRYDAQARRRYFKVGAVAQASASVYAMSAMAE